MTLPDLNTLPLDALYARLRATGLVRRLLELARDEDLGPAVLDVTSEVMALAGQRRSVAVVPRRPGVLAGLAAVPDVLSVFGAADLIATPLARDGDAIPPGSPVLTLAGDRAALLRVERTLLNLLGRLSGIATNTASFVIAMRSTGPTDAQLYDTRKTTPGLRVLEKYAVRCGGGLCHRLGLHDAVLIKDNHVAGLSPDELAQRVARAARLARERHTPSFVQAEVDSLDQLRALASLGPGVLDIVLLDNMPPNVLRQARAIRDAASADRPVFTLEASGGVTLDTIAPIAHSGVERISTGAITHSAAWLDLGLDDAG